MSNYNTFKLFFDNKGNAAPIAEKASRNFQMKLKNTVNLQERLWYFAIGHVFKQLDKKAIFDYKVDDNTQESKPQKFKTLIKDNFIFYTELEKIISDIRNLNSHYIHDFSQIKLDIIDKNIISFLEQAFELAVIHIYMSENNIKYDEFNKDTQKDKKIVKFLRDKFYSLNDNRTDLNENKQKSLDEYKKFRNDFLKKTKKDAINEILFIENEEDFDWTLYETHKVFNVEKGKYLSFYACLFILTMFLYKNEANQLISRIKGFKRNDGNTFRSKRNLFSFYSKKFSSQDIDSEESNLIKFRDIVQYLNHYPKHWNSELEFEPKIPQMTNLLKEKIVEMEIERCYPKYAGNEKFLQFAKYKFFTKKDLKNDDFIKQNFTELEIDVFNFEIEKTKKYKDAYEKLQDPRNGKTKNENEDTLKEEENILNLTTEKLQKRIAQNMLYLGYGRNKDRFMDFAIRYLAEKKYFGNDAEFKMYKFFTTDEQNEYLKTDGINLTKKEKDKLKYHQGKLIEYKTFENHLKKYPEWDTPFVIENNSFHVRINFDNNISKIVCIQRNALIYLLEHLLYSEKTENKGKELLVKYFEQHELVFNEKLEFLKNNTKFENKDIKTEFKKYFPKRLLHNYYKDNEVKNKISSLQKILNDATDSEKRYHDLLVNVIKEENAYKIKYPDDNTLALVENFKKRNKGKQFKLRFIRKAWHLMYFKNSYIKSRANDDKHHKSYHITRDEFNDFSKWMFAFDEVGIYKDFLDSLFQRKRFFENTEFKMLFQHSGSFDDMYKNTKDIYIQWLKTNDTILQKTYELENYKKLLPGNILFININRFIEFLVSEKIIIRKRENQFLYKSLNNERHLITEYYYKDKLEKSEYKTCGKLYNKLKTIKLEDCLLYEIAMDYLKTDKTIVEQAKENIRTIQTRDIELDVINANGNQLFKLIIPFNKLLAYEELKKHKEEQEQIPNNKKTSFWSNLDSYFKIIEKNIKEAKKQNIEIHKDINPIILYFNENNSLKYEHLNTIYNHIISNSAKFTKVGLELEKYYIFTNNPPLKIELNNHLIDIKNIKKIKTCFDIQVPGQKNYNPVIENRRKAFHFGVPNDSYEKILNNIEKKFIQTERKPTKPTKFDDLSKPMKDVCTSFLETIHDNYFELYYYKDGKKIKKDAKKKKDDAIKKFFNEVIKKSIN